jgi:hypothetical protein
VSVLPEGVIVLLNDPPLRGRDEDYRSGGKLEMAVMLRSASTSTEGEQKAFRNPAWQTESRNPEPPVGEPAAAIRQVASKNSELSRVRVIGYV